jgi:hypothetical protein
LLHDLNDFEDVSDLEDGELNSTPTDDQQPSSRMKLNQLHGTTEAVHNSDGACAFNALPNEIIGAIISFIQNPGFYQ